MGSRCPTPPEEAEICAASTTRGSAHVQHLNASIDMCAPGMGEMDMFKGSAQQKRIEGYRTKGERLR